MNERLKTLAEIIHKTYKSPLEFTMLEVGALQLEGEVEPFYNLVSLFPGSKVIGFEVDEALCHKMNGEAEKGFKYYPVALGENNETRPFYETEHPMCASLYKPNHELLKQYNHLEVVNLKNISTLQTHKLDDFILENNIGDIDFVKIDVQGAELDIFKGGKETLKDVSTIVAEVEFIPLYIDQPLFGDVCRYLTQENFMFHHFTGLAGRSLKPVTLENNPYYPSQQMWSDAIYYKEKNELNDDALLKLAVLSFIYNSIDVSYQCFYTFDMKNNTNFHDQFIQLLNQV